MVCYGLLMRISYYRPLHLLKSTRLFKTKPYTMVRMLSTVNTADTKQTYFITTPIFYVNAVPHIGHLYTAVLADTLARWHQVKGHDVIFCTGTDEHGMKIQQAAQKNNESPISHCDKMSAQYQNLFSAANISNTDFIRTTEQRHKTAVQHFWECLSEKGHVYKGSYAGWYCMSDEAFLTEKQVTEVQDKHGQVTKVSIESGHTVEWVEEDNYMFRLSNFQDELLRWLSTNVIKPVKFNNMVTKWVEEGLPDLSISRRSQRLSWGIPVPNDPTQTIYVWLDALVNYLTVGGYPDDNYTWPTHCQVLGKDILRFHAVYWPAFLLAAGLSPPCEILCHSHWLVDGVKMSKSLQNVVDPFKDIDRYTVDGLRYFLVREATPHSDANYSTAKVINILNSELANTLGNLLSRCTSRAVNPQQIFPDFDIDLFEETAPEEDSEMLQELHNLPGVVDEHYMEYNTYKGIDAIMTQLRLTNVFIEQQKPWELCKQDDKTPVLSNVLYITMETLRTCAILMQPVIPEISCRILDQLNIPEGSRMFSDCTTRSDGGWALRQGISGPVFTRIRTSQLTT